MPTNLCGDKCEGEERQKCLSLRLFIFVRDTKTLSNIVTPK